jgi:SulP family sulfate permease
VGGLVSGFYVAIFMFAYASLIFTGELSPFLPNGIGVLLFGAIAIGLVMALTSAIPSLIASPNDNPVAISAILAIAITESMPSTASAQDTFTTVIVSFVLSSLLVGITFILIGRFKLANLVRFIPYPVIGGFLAGTGLIIFRGAFTASAGVALGLSTLDELFQPDILKLWVPALIFGIVMMVVLNRYSHFLIVPGVIIFAVAIFYIGLLLSGMSIEQAIAEGWLIAPVGEGGIWRPILPADIVAADWSVILGQIGTILSLVIVSVIAVLLNSTALESSFQRDIDMGHEMQSAGIANIVAALGGSVAGYHYVGMTVLMDKMRAKLRLVGVIVALVCIFVLIFGSAFVSLVPKYILGGLAFFIGLAFLYDWIYISAKKLSRLDFAIILAIAFVMLIFGPLEGVVFGLLITATLFIVNYSRKDVIRHRLSGDNYHSHIDRPQAHRRVLSEKGSQIHILTLQGFVFFGSSNSLLQGIRDIIAQSEEPGGYLILDFEKVLGLDSSALHSFVKIRHTASERGFTVVYAHFSEDARRAFEQESFIDGSPLVSHVFPDLDHALEWCENQLLAAEDIEPAIESHSWQEELQELFNDDELAGRFMTYLEEGQSAPGEHLAVQGETCEAIHFITSGRATLQLELESGEIVRLRTVGPGSVISIEGLLHPHVNHHAESIVIDEVSTYYRLSAAALARLKEKDGLVAIKFQEFLLGYLADQYTRSTELIKDVLALEE